MFRLVLPGFQRNLPNPDLGDVDTVTLNRINRRNRGNDPIIRDVDHRNKYLRRFTWSNLCPPEVDWFKEFLRRAVGQEITVETHYGEILNCLLVNPDAEVAQPGIATNTVTLDLLVLS